MYQIFAKFYDEMMEDVPYDAWSDYVCDQIKTYGNGGVLLADLGCGSGLMSVRLADAGYEVIGIDFSDDMLAEARDKHSHDKVLYIKQDMRALDLYGSMDAIVSICDSLNYIIKKDELKQVFEHVFYFLNPGGVFIFDLNTAYKFREIIKDETFVYDEPQYTCIWHNYFDVEESIHEYDLTFFVRDEDQYFRYDEIHLERAYEPNDIKELLSTVGFEIIKIEGDMGDSDMETAAKHYFTVKKPQ